MKLDDDVLLAAAKVVLQWGPESLVPKEDRLRAQYPALTDAEMKEALRIGWEILGDAERLAPDIKKGTLGKSGTDALRETRPWLDEDTASSAITQGLYYHWKDTGE